MTLDHESIAEKKAKLQEAIAILNKLRKKSFAEIVNDEVTAGAVQYYLLLGSEAIIDIGSHILTESLHSSPENYEDVIYKLGKRGVISKPLAKRSQGLGRFRNKLIHEYADVDMKKVHAYLQKAPGEFAFFDKAFSRFIKKSSGKR